MADVIDYKIFGDDMQIVEVELDPGEAIRAEAGAMMYMEDGIEMQTSTDGGIFSGFKRMITGESFLLPHFFTQGETKDMLHSVHPTREKSYLFSLLKPEVKCYVRRMLFFVRPKVLRLMLRLQRRSEQESSEAKVSFFSAFRVKDLHLSMLAALLSKNNFRKEKDCVLTQGALLRLKKQWIMIFSL